MGAPWLLAMTWSAAGARVRAQGPLGAGFAAATLPDRGGEHNAGRGEARAPIPCGGAGKAGRLRLPSPSRGVVRAPARPGSQGLLSPEQVHSLEEGTMLSRRGRNRPVPLPPQSCQGASGGEGSIEPLTKM